MKKKEHPTQIRLSPEKRREILHALQGFYREEMDEELSEFNAVRLLDFFVKKLGSPVYNQGVQDARSYLQERLEDLSATFYQSDG